MKGYTMTRYALSILLAMGWLAIAPAMAQDAPAPDAEVEAQPAAEVGEFAPEPAAPAPPPPASQAQDEPVGEVTDLSVRVMELTGQAEYRTSPDAQWQALEQGQVVPAGSDIRTGLSTKVKLRTGPNAILDLGSLTNFAVADVSVQEGNVLRTRAGMRYGKVSFDVKHVGYTNDTQIATPSGVMAVKGTKGDLEFFDNWMAGGNVDNRMHAITNALNNGKLRYLSGGELIGGDFASGRDFVRYQLSKNVEITPTMGTSQGQRQAGTGSYINQLGQNVGPGGVNTLYGETRWRAIRRKVLEKIDPTLSGGEGPGPE